MNTFLKVISEQWVFILLATALIALLYIVKAKKPEEFKRVAYIELVATAAALVVFALFGFQDLFLLAPIILICCELFGYVITGEIVGVILVDYLLILGIDALNRNGVINNLFDTILFYALQIVAAVVIGVLIDNYIRTLNKEKKQKLNAEKEQEQFKQKKLDEHIDDVVSKYGNDDARQAEESGDSDEDLTDEEINEILNKYANFDDPENEILSSSNISDD